MTLQDVYDYYHSNWARAMRETGFSTNAYVKWLNRGCIPLEAQVRIQNASKRALLASVDHIVPQHFNSRHGK